MTGPHWTPPTVGGAAGPPAPAALTTTSRASHSASVTTTAAAGRRYRRCRASGGANRRRPLDTGQMNRKATRAQSSDEEERTRCRTCKRAARVEGRGVSASLLRLHLDIPPYRWRRSRNSAIITSTPISTLMGGAHPTTTRLCRGPASLRDRWTWNRPRTPAHLPACTDTHLRHGDRRVTVRTYSL